MKSMFSGDIVLSPPQPSQAVFDAIRGGNGSVSQQLVLEWRFVITVISKGMTKDQRVVEEMEAVGREAVFKAALYYRASVGVPFSHYAKRSIRNACIRVIMAKPAKVIAHGLYGISSESDFRRPLISDPLARAARNEAISVVEAFVRGLRPELRSVFDQIYVLGRTQRQAAEAMGFSQPWIARLHREMLDLGARTLASYN